MYHNLYTLKIFILEATKILTNLEIALSICGQLFVVFLSSI